MKSKSLIEAAFVDPLPGRTPDQALGDRELVRAVRQALAAEEEAVHLYDAVADATNNEEAKAILLDIAKEERVHVGELQRLLMLLDPDEAQDLRQGAEEVDSKISGIDTGSVV